MAVPNGFNGRKRVHFYAFIHVIAVMFYAAGIQDTFGYGSGASPSVCDTMIPGHGAEPQTTPNPYTIVLSATNVSAFAGMEITLTSENGNDEFKGFLIQVRRVGGDGIAAGRFFEIPQPGIAKTMNCFGVENSATTHITGDLKNSVTVRWYAVDDEFAEYQVFYSVVGLDSATYWTHIAHNEIIHVYPSGLLTTTAEPPRNASDILLAKWRSVYTGCGEIKGCFGIPAGCVEHYDPSSLNPITCDIMATWAKYGDVNEFRLTGRTGGQAGYIALGMSSDALMGKDSVVGCAMENAASPLEIERYENPGKYNQKHTDPSLGLTPLEKSIVEGNIFCDFLQANHRINDIEIDFNATYYLLLSKGLEAFRGGLGMHLTLNDRAVSNQSVHMSDMVILGTGPYNE